MIAVRKIKTDPKEDEWMQGAVDFVLLRRGLEVEVPLSQESSDSKEKELISGLENDAVLH